MTVASRVFGSLSLLTAMAFFSAGCAESKPQAKSDGGGATAEPKTPIDGTLTIDEPAKEPAAPEAPPAPETAAKPSAPRGKVTLGSPDLTAGIPGEGPVKLAEIMAWLANPENHKPLEIELPMGLATGASQIQGLDQNPMTRAKIELGRQLYFDPRLSFDTTISCASCHDPEEGFAKHTQFGLGISGQLGGRNSPVSYNRILSAAQFWDGRSASLEAQAVGPIANPIEMGNKHENCVASVQKVPGYAAQFESVFGKLDIDAIGQAIATFERTIVTAPSPFDYYEQYRPFENQDPDDLKDDPATFAKYQAAAAGAKEHPLTESARRGRDLYFSDKASCSACHVGANLTDEKYHNLGIGMDKEKPDIGREEVSKDPKDHGAFKTPTIRNVALSAPYMHDGSLNTLEEVVEMYAKGGHPNPSLSDKIKKLDLTDQDKKDLVEFMKQGCTSEFPKVARARVPE